MKQQELKGKRMFEHEILNPINSASNFFQTPWKCHLPNGNTHLKDQLKRAATSPLKIAEISGKMTNTDKLQFYSTARGSVMECAAISDVFVRLDPKLKMKSQREREP